MTNFVKMSGFWLVFPCQATEKKQYGRNSASTVSLLYWTLVADGGTQTPEFQSLVNVAVFRWDHRFPRGVRITGRGKMWYVSCGREFTPAWTPIGDDGAV